MPESPQTPPRPSDVDYELRYAAAELGVSTEELRRAVNNISADPQTNAKGTSVPDENKERHHG